MAKTRIAIFEGYDDYNGPSRASRSSMSKKRGKAYYEALRRKYGGKKRRSGGKRKANWFAKCVGSQMKKSDKTFKQAVNACKRK